MFDVFLSICNVLTSLVRFSKKDDIEINVIDVDFNSFVFDFLTKWFNIVFLNVMIMLSRWLSFVEHLCFLFKSLFINDFKLINVVVNVFDIIALSFFCSHTTWYKDLCFMTFFIQLFFLFQSVVYDIENQRLCIYFNMFHIFTCLKSVYENSASSNDLAHSKCIFTYFCIYMFYDHSLDTLNTDVFYNLNHKNAWFLCRFYDILSRQLTCSSSQSHLQFVKSDKDRF